MYTVKRFLQQQQHTIITKEKEKHGIVLHEIRKIKMLLLFLKKKKEIHIETAFTSFIITNNTTTFVAATTKNIL